MNTKEKKRWKAEEIIRIALGRAILEGLKLEDQETIWISSRKDYAEDLLNIWLDDEKGNVAIDKLVKMIIH
jgi:hypothetical protein